MVLGSVGERVHTPDVDVRLTVAEVIEANAMGKAAFPDQPERMGRIEGVIDGKRYAMMVSPWMIEDEQMCKSMLRQAAMLEHIVGPELYGQASPQVGQ